MNTVSTATPGLNYDLDVVLQEVLDQHNLYVRSRAPACSERAHDLSCFQSSVLLLVILTRPCMYCVAQGSPSHLEDCSSHDILIADWRVGHRAVVIRALRNRTTTREYRSEVYLLSEKKLRRDPLQTLNQY